MKTASLITHSLAAFAILAAVAQPASARVIHYQDYVQGLSETIVQYDFDGSNLTERREDKTGGGNDLVEKLTTTYGLSGADPTSQAVQGGFFTSSPLSLPVATSFEAIVASLDDRGYLVAAI